MESIEIRTKDDVVICTPNDFSMLTPYVLFEKSDWYKNEIQFVRDYLKPGMHFLDIGASFGVYALMAAKKVGESGLVTAFENDIIARNFLELSIKTNNFEHLSLIRKTVSDTDGVANWVSRSIPELSSFDENGDEQVESVRLDSWWEEGVISAVDFIKINVNGFEHKVLQAATSLLKETEPILLISTTPENYSEIRTTLESLDYQLFEYLPGSGILTSFVDTELIVGRNLIGLTPARLNELKEEGWILNEELTFEKPESDRWKSFFERLTWSGPMMFGWEYVADAKENESYFQALNFLIAAEEINSSDDISRSKKNQVTSYLIESVHRLIDLYNSGSANISVAFTLARGLLALGKRDQAVHIMQRVIDETAFGQKNMLTPFPYLLPIKGQESTNIKTDYSKWLMVRCIESWLLTKNETTFWSNDQEQKIIEILDGNPEISMSFQNIHKIRNYSKNKERKQEKNKSMLFITTDFPPYDEGRIGHSLRAYTLANFFAENGYDVYLVILATLIADREAPYMHPKIQILNSLFHEQKAVKDDLSVPEFCADFMQKYAVPNLLTSSPPLTSSLFGLKIKERLGDSIYWISDFRDFIHIHPITRSKTQEGHQEQKSLELQVMQESDSVLNVSTGMTKIAEDLHLEFNEEIDLDKFEIVENGYIDHESLNAHEDVISFAEKARSEGRIVMYYAGTGSLIGVQQFEGVYKDLTFIFDVFKNNPKIAQNYALIIQGKVQVNLDYLKTLNTKLMFKFFDPVPNAEMQANLKVADIGLSVNSDEIATPYIMGGKLYDYARSELALLLIYPDNPFSLQEFSKRHNDKCFFANVFDPESVKEVLSKIILEKNNLDSRKFTAEEVKPFSRNEQYKKILSLIEASNEKQIEGTFVHFCYNSIYAQTLADLLKFTNETTNQHHILYVEEEQSINGFTVNFDAHPDAYLFSKNSDNQRIGKVITDETVNAIFMHGLFRQWQFSIVNTIGGHKHIGWMIWGGDLYNPIKNGTTHAFPGKKISSIHTPLEGDRTMFSKYYGEVSCFDFGYLYPGLYGEINPEVPKERTRQIIVGNSGDASNNHIEILTQLASKKDISEYKLILPVAYGFHDEYRHQVIKKIDELGLRNQVQFHSSFLTSKDYLQLVAESDMMIMAHNRQQAMGNLLMALYLNKPAILRKEIIKDGSTTTNLGWTYLTSTELNPFSYEDFEQLEKLSDIPLNSSQIHEKNQEAINSYYGIETRSRFLIESCKAILETSKTKERALV